MPRERPMTCDDDDLANSGTRSAVSATNTVGSRGRRLRRTHPTPASSFLGGFYNSESSQTPKSASEAEAIQNLDTEPSYKHSSGMSTPAHSVLTEEEIKDAPMPEEHKQIALRQLHRLRKNTHESDWRQFSIHANRATACEQLARMTLVFQAYAKLRDEGKLADNEVESMLQDVLDACLHVAKKQDALPQPLPAGANGILEDSCGQEIAALAQEAMVEGADDFAELWNVRAWLEDQPPVPEWPGNEMSEMVDWKRSTLHRSWSDDDVRHFRSESPEKDHRKMREKLYESRPYRFDRSWPARGRVPTGVSDMDWPNIMARAHKTADMMEQENLWRLRRSSSVG